MRLIHKSLHVTQYTLFGGSLTVMKLLTKIKLRVFFSNKKKKRKQRVFAKVNTFGTIERKLAGSAEEVRRHDTRRSRVSRLR